MDNQTTQEDRTRFLQEAVLMGQFKDPNIVAVFGIITINSSVSFCIHLFDQRTFRSNRNESIIIIKGVKYSKPVVKVSTHTA